jgi:hypothetical protein
MKASAPRRSRLVKPRRIRKVMGWAEKQAEAIVDAFLADEEPEDLLRLERAIANALHQAYGSRLTTRRRRVRSLSGIREKRRKSSG